jgi:hypothetical protein
MSDEHTTDATEGEAATGPRHEADERTVSDAGLTGDEGVQTTQPPPGNDGEHD